MSFDFGGVSRSYPVSYTHLDVYKRQELTSGKNVVYKDKETGKIVTNVKDAPTN